MSLENHPNIHAVNFVLEVVDSYHRNLRGKANKNNCPDIRNEISEFFQKVGEKLDKFIEKNQSFSFPEHL
jgi:hypothetical protein